MQHARLHRRPGHSNKQHLGQVRQERLCPDYVVVKLFHHQCAELLRQVLACAEHDLKRVADSHILTRLGTRGLLDHFQLPQPNGWRHWQPHYDLIYSRFIGRRQATQNFQLQAGVVCMQQNAKVARTQVLHSHCGCFLLVVNNGVDPGDNGRRKMGRVAFRSQRAFAVLWARKTASWALHGDLLVTVANRRTYSAEDIQLVSLGRRR
mmetsp:Transcript_5783/g.16243  ORF Transcript_5783/g.16243 Transcript_5783/m.16243 type:complete len:207 (+) Transcript_5783:857-1477(+)